VPSPLTSAFGGPATSVSYAHGVGGRQDLPLPFGLVVVGAAVALVVSFVVLGLAWRQARFRGDDAGAPLPLWVSATVDSRPVRWGLRALGLLLVGFTAMAAFLAPDLATNPTAGLVYVVFWLGLVPASLLLGPIWPAMNPVRTLHLGLARLLGEPPEDAGIRPLPAGLGYWPAAAGLFAFTWLELVAPDRATTPVIRTFFLAYFGVHLVAVTLFGSRWLDRGEAFEVLSRLIGRLSPFGRRRDGRVVVRNPLDGLDGLAPAPGLAATVAVVLGSTAYDSLSNAPFWVRRYQASDLGPTITGTLGLLACVAVIAGAYLLAVSLTVSLSGRTSTMPRRELAGAYAHSLVPIAIGYLVAHYFSLFVLEGQRTAIYMSDPFATSANWFGTAERVVDNTIAEHPGAISIVQVLAIIVGHVLGVIAAHDRAVRLLPRRAAVIGQLPLLVLMIGYTIGGLLLLFAT